MVENLSKTIVDIFLTNIFYFDNYTYFSALKSEIMSLWILEVK